MYKRQKKSYEQSQDDPQKQSHGKSKWFGGGDTEEHTVYHKTTKELPQYKNRVSEKGKKKTTETDQSDKTWSKYHKNHEQARKK